jgi:hypothetical protein
VEVIGEYSSSFRFGLDRLGVRCTGTHHGVLGLISPDIQFGMMGFEILDKRPAGAYTPAVVATTSIAAVNMGVLYLLGVAKDWPGFIAFTVAARLFMCAGFIVLIVAGQAPDAFIGVMFQMCCFFIHTTRPNS